MENSAGQSGARGGRGGSRSRARVHPTLIGTLVRAGRIREAIGIGESSLTRGTATREECEALAHAYWALGMGRSAERLAKALSQQRPTSIEGLALLGDIYVERLWASQLQGVVRRLATEARWHPQVQALSRAMETLGAEDSPPTGDDINSRLARAEWCLRRGWIGEADSILRKLIQNHPDLERARELLWGCQRERRLEARFGGGIGRQLESEGKAGGGAQAQANQKGPGSKSAISGQYFDEDDDEGAETVIAHRPEVESALAGPKGGESEAIQRVLEAADGDEGAMAIEGMDSSTLKGLLEPTQIVVEAAEHTGPIEALAGSDWYDADGSAEEESEEDWEDYEDDDESEDEDLDSLTASGPIRLSLRGQEGGPSPLRERLRDQVVVIERGDQPRMITGKSNPKGIWFRGASEIAQDVVEDVSLSPSPRRDRSPAQAPSQAPSKATPSPRSARLRPPPSAPPPGRTPTLGGPRTSPPMPGRFGFDDDDDESEDEGKTEVMDLNELSEQRGRSVSLAPSRIHLGKGHPLTQGSTLEDLPTEDTHQGPEQWDEGPTRAFVDEMLENAFVEDEPPTRIVSKNDFPQPGDFDLDDDPEEEVWEQEVATRIAGLDEINDGRRSPSPGEATRPLPGRGPVAGPQDLTQPIAPQVGPHDVTSPLPSHNNLHSNTSTIPLNSESTRTAPRISVPISRQSPLAVPEEPSILASPALWLSAIACTLLIGAFSWWTGSQLDAELNALDLQSQSAVLKGDSGAMDTAQKAVEAFIAEHPKDAAPAQALLARLGWRRYAEIGGGRELPPGVGEMSTLEETLGLTPTLAAARADRDRYIGDILQGALRSEEALGQLPQEPMLALGLARLYLEESPPQTAAAAELLAKARTWVDRLPPPASTADGSPNVDLTVLMKAELTYAELLVAEARGNRNEARQHLSSLETLNPAHPWLRVQEAYLSVPDDANQAQALEVLAAAQTRLSAGLTPRAKSWLLLRQMDLALEIKEMGSAIALAERAAAADPTWPEALWRAAQAQTLRGDNAQALARIQQAGVLAPLNVRVLEDRISLLLDAQDYGGAELLMAGMPESLKESPSVLRARAQVALARREVAQAEKLLGSVLRKDPDNPRTLLLQSQVGTLLEGRRSGRPPLLTLLERPEELGVGLSHARLKALLSGLSSGGESRAYSRDALALAPRDPVVLEILALNDEARGDTRGALKHLEAARSLSPERLRTTLLLARLEALTGEVSKAASHWETIKDDCTEGPLCNEVATLVQSK